MFSKKLFSILRCRLCVPFMFELFERGNKFNHPSSVRPLEKAVRILVNVIKQLFCEIKCLNQWLRRFFLHKRSEDLNTRVWYPRKMREGRLRHLVSWSPGVRPDQPTFGDYLLVPPLTLFLALLRGMMTRRLCHRKGRDFELCLGHR